jgi:hypothetical protein
MQRTRLVHSVDRFQFLIRPEQKYTFTAETAESAEKCIILFPSAISALSAVKMHFRCKMPSQTPTGKPARSARNL